MPTICGAPSNALMVTRCNGRRRECPRAERPPVNGVRAPFVAELRSHLENLVDRVEAARKVNGIEQGRASSRLASNSRIQGRSRSVRPGRTGHRSGPRQHVHAFKSGFNARKERASTSGSAHTLGVGHDASLMLCATPAHTRIQVEPKIGVFSALELCSTRRFYGLRPLQSWSTGPFSASVNLRDKYCYGVARVASHHVQATLLAARVESCTRSA